MNRKRNRIMTGLLLAGILTWPGLGMAAGNGEQTDSEESINQMVEEAQRVATEWAQRIREWKSGAEKRTTYMGIVIEQVPDVLRDYIELPKGVGLLLVSIAADGPADRAGLIKNDILIEFDGQLVINFSQLSTLIELKGPGATVPVKILRKGEPMTFEVTLEERMRRGGQFLEPSDGAAPDVNDIPNPDEIGMIMEKIEEWIPGSVRVYIDDKEQVHVDLSDLKEDLDDLRTKLSHVEIIQSGKSAGLVTEHGDMGARTTVVRVADKNISYKNNDGKLVLNSTPEGQYAMAWDAEGQLLYEGNVPEDYEASLPDKVVRLINALKESRGNLDLESQELEIHLNKEEIEPLTWVGNEFDFDSRWGFHE